MFEVIERLKAEWTDKYVVVASAAPELARFAQAGAALTTASTRSTTMPATALPNSDRTITAAVPPSMTPRHR